MINYTIAAPPSLIPILVALIGSGGLFGGIYALLKLRPEAGEITVSAAQNAVLIQDKVLDRLNQDNIRLGKRVNELEIAIADMAVLHQRINSLEDERFRLRKENATLVGRVAVLEKELQSFIENGGANDH